MDLGPRIAELRRERGLSQRKLALQAGVDASTIACWETGARSPTMENRAKLAEIFGVPMRDMIADLPEKLPSSVVITEPELIAFIRNYRRLTPQARRAMLTVVQAASRIPALQESPT